ncbi:MAG: EamA family transporter [Hyphomicrobiaceae bacterium]
MQSELLALGSAVMLALGSLFVVELKGRIDAQSVARWTMLLAGTMTGTAAVVDGGWATVGQDTLIYLAISGFFAISIAGPGYYGSIYKIGPRNTLLIFSLNAPIAAIAGFLLFGERFALKELAALGLILSGVALAVMFGEPKPKPVRALRPLVPGRRDEPVAEPRRPISWVGVGLALMAAFGQGLGNVAAKPAMAAAVDPFAAMTVRAFVGVIFLYLLLLLPFKALRPAGRMDAVTLFLIFSSAGIGMGLGITMLMAALADGDVGIMSTLGAMTPVAVLPLVWARTGIAPPLPAWIGAFLAVTGTAVLFISGCIGKVCI